MGKKHKKHEADEPEVETPAVVEDSDDGSTQTETDALIGSDNDDSDFGC